MENKEHKIPHPNMTRIKYDGKLSEDAIDVIIIMVDKVSKMTPEELKIFVSENRKPKTVKEAEKFIIESESDLGFMGSPKYDEARKIVDAYRAAIDARTFTTTPEVLSTTQKYIVDLYIGQEVRHKEVDNGNKTLEVIGIKKDEVLLKGTFQLNDAAYVEREGWKPIKGLIIRNIWGNWNDPDDDFFERITKNTGPRD